MDLHNYIQDELLNLSERECVISQDVDTADNYHLAVAQRLLNAFEIFLSNRQLNADFYCALRSYLGYTQKTLKLPAELIDHGMLHRFNLVKYAGNQFAISNQYPSYINSEYVERVFKHESPCENNQTKYVLKTSPFIEDLTGYPFFKTNAQQIAVNGALNLPKGFTSLICLPTGAGKSVITQTVAYQEKRSLTIVIVPTVSLIQDQERVAKRIIKHDTSKEIFGYYASKDVTPILTAINDRTARVIFLSPEALQLNKTLHDTVLSANKSGYLKNLIIDEAHMVVEWGANFRLDYQTLESFRNKLMYENSELRTYLMSATYDKREIEILKSLFVESDDKWIEIRCDSLRKEPLYGYIPCSYDYQKRNKFLELVDLLPHPIIVYVKRPKVAEELKELLKKNKYTNVHTFTGDTNNSDREKLINDWSDNKFDTLIATSAFGIGVDKTDVRTVLHLYVPETPNMYYQEVGRGGRDGYPSLGIMCINQINDLANTKDYISREVLSVEKTIKRWFSMLKKATKYGKEKFRIDTSIIPSYTDDDAELFGNQKHIQWNIYVILLLRRYNLIKIEDINLNTAETTSKAQRIYIVSLKVLDCRLLEDNLVSTDLFTEIHNKETKYYYTNFSNISKSITSSPKQCWSEMFYKVFDLVDEYCPGCDNHKKVLSDTTKQYPLKKRIDYKQPTNATAIDNLFTNTRKILIISPNKYLDLIACIANVTPINLVLCDSQIIQNNFINLINYGLKNCHFNIYNVYEFKDIVQNNADFYLNGVTLVAYSDDMRSNQTAYRIAERLIRNLPNKKVIHLIDKDDTIMDSSMKISECIDGAHYDEKVLERIKQNV